MSRTTFRTLLALFAVAIVAAIPAIASAHKSHKSHKADVQAVGSIVSYTDGTLVITSGGAPVSAKVTFRTKIKWAPRGHHYGWYKGRGHGARAAHRGNDGPGHKDHGTGGGLPTGGGMPTAGGIPTGGGMPTGGGLPGGRKARFLTPGTGVADADLKLTSSGLVWTKVVLIRPAATPAT